MEERLNGIQEASGSIPLISTRKKPLFHREMAVFSYFFRLLIFHYDQTTTSIKIGR